MTTGEQATGWSWRGLAGATAIAGVAFGAGAALGYAVSHERPPQDASPSTATRDQMKPRPSDAELAILAPLREGAHLEGFDIVEIDPVGDGGVLRIVCRRADGVVRLAVALSSEQGPSPPALAGRYAVFYELEKATEADGQRLALALATTLQANAGVPAPPGMGPYRDARHGGAP